MVYMLDLPVGCSSDSECSSGYFCGSPVPGPDKNLFDNPSSSISGNTVFLLKESMGFDGTSVVSLPSNTNPPLMQDLTIFATVCQEEGNDGYIVGKGINDQMRDFGLYLRSSKETVWLAYGATDDVMGFRHFIFFYNVTVADGACHSVAAVIDSFSNRALLYIDGTAVRIQAPLPGVPNFRPYVSLHDYKAHTFPKDRGTSRSMIHFYLNHALYNPFTNL